MSGSTTPMRSGWFVFGALALVVGVSWPACAAETWSSTGSLANARQNHAATLLKNGKVLVAGGVAGSYPNLSSCELYDPATGTWTPTGDMASVRQGHTATVLGNGKVLVAGGATGSYPNLPSCELYDPAMGTWSPTGDMSVYRQQHTATLLGNGRVLVAGGGSSLSLCELYDPATGNWSAAAPMGTTRSSHTATLLGNGKVLVTGGMSTFAVSSCELYDPATNTWTATGSMAKNRAVHTATLLNDAKVLVVGGDSVFDGPGWDPLSSCELYDPATATWSGVGPMAAAREFHTAILLGNGSVLAAGGYYSSDGNHYLASCELYDPASRAWGPTGSMIDPRSRLTATLLGNGQVLAAGGNGSTILSSCELYDPPRHPVITSATVATGEVGQAFNYQITGSVSPTSFGAVNLPPGLSVNAATGVISGTPNLAGTTDAVISATNAYGTGSATLRITINPPSNPLAPVITSATTATGIVGEAFSYQITASKSPTSFNATNLPGGLSVDTVTGAITGAPSAAGTTDVVISATNANGTGAATLTITVNLPDVPRITSMATATGIVVQPFSYTIAATGNPASFNATNLPPGFAVNTSTGTITGTPTLAGITNVTISATNAAGTGSAILQLTIVKGPPVITWSGPASIIYPTPLGPVQLDATTTVPGTFVYTPPAGTVLEAGAGHQLSVTFTPDDTLNYEPASGSVYLRVLHPAPVITSEPTASPNPVATGVPVQFAVAGSGFEVTWCWYFGDGTMDSSNSTNVSHAYAAVGSYTVSLKASNEGGEVNRTLTIVVQGPSKLDTDGDGFPDELEIGLQTSPTDAQSTPFAGAPAGTPLALLIPKMSIKLNFAKTAQDAISFSGTLPVPDGFAVAEQPVAVDVGGVVRSFTLDAKGKSPKSQTESFKLAVKARKKVVYAQDAKYSVKLSKGSFSALLSDEGLVNAALKDSSCSVPVIVLFNQQVFQADQPQLYSAVAGKSGRTKMPR